MKPVRLRPAARADTLGVAAHYIRDSGLGIALAFTDQLQRALAHVASRPQDGERRFAEALDLPGLRARPVARFPQVVFYLERADHVDVLRILHAKRDVPASLAEG